MRAPFGKPTLIDAGPGSVNYRIISSEVWLERFKTEASEAWTVQNKAAGMRRRPIS